MSDDAAATAAKKKRGRKPGTTVQNVSPLYFSMMRAIERERHRAGFALWALEERAGLSSGHLAKLNSGKRIASWPTLEYLVAALMPDGATLKLVPRTKAVATGPAIGPHFQKILRAYERRRWAQLAPLGGIARMEKLSPEERRELGRRGAEARWRHKRRLQPRAPNSPVKRGGSNGHTRSRGAEPR
jgi:hypothetical protein